MLSKGAVPNRRTAAIIPNLPSKHGNKLVDGNKPTIALQQHAQKLSHWAVLSAHQDQDALNSGALRELWL